MKHNKKKQEYEFSRFADIQQSGMTVLQGFKKSWAPKGDNKWEPLPATIIRRGYLQAWAQPCEGKKTGWMAYLPSTKLGESTLAKFCTNRIEAIKQMCAWLGLRPQDYILNPNGTSK